MVACRHRRQREQRKPTMKRPVVTAITILMLTAGVARALHVWEDPNAWSTGFTTYKIPADKPVFAGDELSLDLSGSYIAPQRGLQHVFETNIRHTGKWGGNVGLNYFPDQ